MSNVISIKTESLPRIQQLAEVSASMDSMDIPSKFAIVASKSLHCDLGRLYATYRKLNARSTKQVRVFGTREDALGWLDTKEEGELPGKTDSSDD